MADLFSEGLIPLGECPKLKGLPVRHLATWHGWAANGYKGILLETVRFAGTLCTSKAAIARFIERMTAADNPPLTKQTTANQKVTSATRAGNYLDSLGIN